MLYLYNIFLMHLADTLLSKVTLLLMHKHACSNNTYHISPGCWTAILHEVDFIKRVMSLVSCFYYGILSLADLAMKIQMCFHHMALVRNSYGYEDT